MGKEGEMTHEQFASWLALEGWYLAKDNDSGFVGWQGIQNDALRKNVLLFSRGQVAKGHYVAEAARPDASIHSWWHNAIIEYLEANHDT